MQLALWDIVGSELSELKSKQSNDWYWRFKDYPEFNGLKVFSCFSGGAVALWAINLPDIMLLETVKSIQK